jgi:hypothetical protein
MEICTVIGQSSDILRVLVAHGLVQMGRGSSPRSHLTGAESRGPTDSVERVPVKTEVGSRQVGAWEVMNTKCPLKWSTTNRGGAKRMPVRPSHMGGIMGGKIR